MISAWFKSAKERVEHTFRRANYDEAQFPAIATEVLSSAPLEGELDFEKLTAWICDPASMLSPSDAASGFSDLQVTLERGSGFSIQLLVWTVGSTDIHQHSFSGAFAVLRGSSIHTRYAVETKKRISAACSLVRCSVEEVEFLREGDVRSIHSGGGFVHSTFHLDEPTLSIVIRTDHEPWTAPQLLIIPPSYAVGPEWLKRDGRLPMLEKSLRALHKLRDPHFKEIFIRRVEELDFPRVCLLLRSCHTLLYRPELEEVLEHVSRAHGAIATGLAEALQRMDRTELIKNLRGHTEDPQARRVLAALMVAEDRCHAQRIFDRLQIAADVLDRCSDEIPAIRKLWNTLPERSL